MLWIILYILLKQCTALVKTFYGRRNELEENETISKHLKLKFLLQNVVETKQNYNWMAQFLYGKCGNFFHPTKSRFVYSHKCIKTKTQSFLHHNHSIIFMFLCSKTTKLFFQFKNTFLEQTLFLPQKRNFHRVKYCILSNSENNLLSHLAPPKLTPFHLITIYFNSFFLLFLFSFWHHPQSPRPHASFLQLSLFLSKLPNSLPESKRKKVEKKVTFTTSYHLLFITLPNRSAHTTPLSGKIVRKIHKKQSTKNETRL